MWAKRHLEAGQPVLESSAAYHPVLGWTVAPNLDQELGRVHTNSAGMRGQIEFPVERTSRPRMLLLGNSYTFGAGVSDQEAYPAVLASLLPEWEILNFGVSGYGADQAALLYEEVGRQYEPDVVVLGFWEGGHLSPEGNRLAAQHIQDFLRAWRRGYRLPPARPGIDPRARAKPARG